MYYQSKTHKKRIALCPISYRTAYDSYYMVNADVF